MPLDKARVRQPAIDAVRQGRYMIFLVYPKGNVMQGFITEPKSILGELNGSLENGNAIGIWAPSLGAGLKMCAVERILDDDVEHDKVIVLKERDLNGAPLPLHVLFLLEIEKVFPLKAHYNDSLPEPQSKRFDESVQNKSLLP